ncbi:MULTISPECIES: pentapeptide repeat-containing protein [Streptomyces griseus group]|uniref:pentapeptide repeat-containing protein n=1 Tax=Streptomyces griseus group TaxID=629295 RepID=UPI002E10CA64|nr:MULTISPECIES: pentapeptide repeat-containing protein [Streptomyces griseus group]WSI46078.1 pentapeptide repeat-containing protein [Streptomyces cyaneofuscatus]WSI52669.1 pentapeptide repeat-containing protein [Streptomyces cyaneofuscatus]
MWWKRARLSVLTVIGAGLLCGVLAVVFTPLTGRLARWLTSDDWSALDGAARAAAVGQLRLAVVQVVAAIGAGIALTYTARTFRLTRRGQVTDRFTKALERLSSSDPYVRLGGVLAMEQIVQDAPDQGDHAARVLNAFVRRQAPVAAKTPLAAAQLAEKPEEHVQEALRALTTERPWRGGSRAPVDLAGLHLRKAQLAGACLDGALLKGATLSEADLRGACLTGADLADADLTRADLSSALGLTVAQVLLAGSLLGCRLPDVVAADSAVASRLTAST